MTDASGNIKLSLIFFAAFMAVAIVALMFCFTAGSLLWLLPLILALAAFGLTFGLTFVPFFKDREVLLIPIAVVFSLLAGLICHFVF